MAASKLKNLILIVLLLVNVFLMSIVIPSQLTQRQQRKAADDRLAALFSDAGIAIGNDSIPARKAQQELRLVCGEETRTAAAQGLLGEQTQQEENVGGLIYSADGGYIRFLDTQFSASIVTEAENPEQTAAALAEKLGITVHAVHSHGEGDATVCTVVPQMMGFPVFSAPVSVRFEAEGRVLLDGTLLVESALKRTQNTDTCTARDALVAFLDSRLDIGWLGSEITAVTQGWQADSRSGLLQPAWMIATDAGNYLVCGSEKTVTAVR